MPANNRSEQAQQGARDTGRSDETPAGGLAATSAAASAAAPNFDEAE